MSRPNLHWAPGLDEPGVFKVAVQYRGRTPRGRPDGVRERALGYFYALALRQYPSVRLVSLTAMSTHYHLVVSDKGETKQSHFRRWQDRRDERKRALPPRQPDAMLGVLSDIIHWVDTQYAKWLNDLDKTTGPVFEKDAVSAQLLIGARAVIDEFSYMQLNPVKAGLENRPARWSAHFGCGLKKGNFKPQVLERFERPPGVAESWPDEATLRFELPEVVRHFDEEELEQTTMELVAMRLKEIRAERKKAGKGYLGMKAVSRLDPLTPLPPPDEDEQNEKRYGGKPRLKCCDPVLFKAWIWRIRQWLDAYDEAFMRWRAGDENVVFPRGTYQRAAYCGANVA